VHYLSFPPPFLRPYPGDTFVSTCELLICFFWFPLPSSEFFLTNSCLTPFPPCNLYDKLYFSDPLFALWRSRREAPCFFSPSFFGQNLFHWCLSLLRSTSSIRLSGIVVSLSPSLERRALANPWSLFAYPPGCPSAQPKLRSFFLHP